MIKILDKEIDFDMTSPLDAKRYFDGVENMEKKSIASNPFTGTEDEKKYVTEYIEWLNGQLKIFGDFIDDVFGDGIANELLGLNPSLTKVTEIFTILDKELEKQGEFAAKKLYNYVPNRATRRSKK